MEVCIEEKLDVANDKLTFHEHHMQNICTNAKLPIFKLLTMKSNDYHFYRNPALSSMKNYFGYGSCQERFKCIFSTLNVRYAFSLARESFLGCYSSWKGGETTKKYSLRLVSSCVSCQRTFLNFAFWVNSYYIPLWGCSSLLRPSVTVF